jgi:hypothetical protein
MNRRVRIPVVSAVLLLLAGVLGTVASGTTVAQAATTSGSPQAHLLRSSAGAPRGPTGMSSGPAVLSLSHPRHSHAAHPAHGRSLQQAHARAALPLPPARAPHGGTSRPTHGTLPHHRDLGRSGHRTTLKGMAALPAGTSSPVRLPAEMERPAPSHAVVARHSGWVEEGRGPPRGAPNRVSPNAISAPRPSAVFTGTRLARPRSNPSAGRAPRLSASTSSFVITGRGSRAFPPVGSTRPAAAMAAPPSVRSEGRRARGVPLPSVPGRTQ